MSAELDTATAQSALEQVLTRITTMDIPALYFLLEKFAFLSALVIFGSACYSMWKVRALTGNMTMQSMHMADVTPMSLGAKFFAMTFLASFGQGQALISNTLFLESFDSYSIDTLRSISCAVSDATGCLSYELGMFQDGSWSENAVNQTFFEFFTAVIVMAGTIYYLIGWLSFAKLGSEQGRNKTFWQCIWQIFIGALLMRPTETWRMLTGGYF
ncbi:hypothetical protein [Vibrio sp. Hal054]|uniref:hypothetical protein n=1 Tax=Vibrio sp. Hal054 TaxID=3035158 RepID=UPI00301D300F